VRPSRLTLILVAVTVGALVLAGLIVRGPIGGVLLGIVVAILVVVSSAGWAALSRSGRAGRGLVIGGLAALAVVKFAGKA
jgi:hypothetical protein